ncbi:transposase, partial [Methylobacterium variabile]|uniref:transposase n=1 Tax=Methylobacterium variabile TaxID=298794 RepID=UPI000653889F
MPRTRPPYPAEFGRQMVELVRAGRDPTDLAREFEPSVQAIRNWVAEADQQEGQPPAAEAVLSASEREE